MDILGWEINRKNKDSNIGQVEKVQSDNDAPVHEIARSLDAAVSRTSTNLLHKGYVTGYGLKKYLEYGYEGNISIYAIIRMIIDCSKSYPWIIERQLGNGEWKEIDGLGASELLKTPNQGKGYTFEDVHEQVMLYLLCTGNAYLFGENILGTSPILELDVLPSQYVDIQPKSNDFFNVMLDYRFSFAGTNRVLSQEEVCHIKFANPSFLGMKDMFYGLSPISVASWAAQSENDKWEAAAFIFQNRGASNLITDKSDRPMTNEEALKIQGAFDNRTAGTRKVGQNVITNKNLAVIRLTMSPEELQLIESGVITTRALCNVFGVPSELFNDPDNKTYNNRVEAEKSLYTRSIMPLSKRIADHYTRFFITSHFPGKNVRIRQDFSSCEALQEYRATRGKTFADMKIQGIYTANEVRKKMGDEPSVDENADKLIISSTNTLVANLGQEQPVANVPTA